MKKDYSDFAKRNFEYYKTLKRDGLKPSIVFIAVKLFDELFEELEIEDELKIENEKNR